MGFDYSLQGALLKEACLAKLRLATGMTNTKSARKAITDSLKEVCMDVQGKYRDERVAVEKDFEAMAADIAAMGLKNIDISAGRCYVNQADGHNKVYYMLCVTHSGDGHSFNHFVYGYYGPFTSQGWRKGIVKNFLTDAALHDGYEKACRDKISKGYVEVPGFLTRFLAESKAGDKQSRECVAFVDAMLAAM